MNKRLHFKFLYLLKTKNIILMLGLMFLGLIGSQKVEAQSFACGDQYLDDCSCDGLGMLIADSEPCNFNSAHNQTYLLVDAANAIISSDADNDEIVAISSNGVFDNVPTGDYSMYVLSYSPIDEIFFNSQLQVGGDLDLLQTLGTEMPVGTWTSNIPEFILMVSDLATVNAPQCNCSSISNGGGSGNVIIGGQEFSTDNITITGPPNQIWILDLGQSVGMFDENGDPLTGLQYATEVSPGVYEFNFVYDPSVGYTAYFLNNFGGQESISVAPIVVGGDCITTVTCPTEQACTPALTPILICPDYCVDGSFTITSIQTLYQCSIELFTNCFEYTPLPGMEFVGSDVINFTAINSQGVCVEGSINVTIGACNTPPVAVDDNATSTGEVTYISILNNDYDTDGDFVYLCGGYGQPLNGSVEFLGGSFAYTPNAGFSGVDSFTYTICDGNGGQSTATVYITVDPVEDCENTDLQYCTEHMTPFVICPEFCLFENNGMPYAVSTAQTTYSCSVYVMSDECVRYTPLPGFYGQDVITIVACGTQPGYTDVCDEVTVYMDVLEDCTPPPCSADQELCTGHMEPITFCVDFCDPAATITDASTIYDCSLNLLGGNCIKYVPLPGYYGTDYIEVQGCNGGNCEDAIITVHVDDDCTQFGGKNVTNIDAICEVVMPKNFVPNSVGTGTVLDIDNFGECFENSKVNFEIYNMAGQLVYQTQSTDGTLWDASEFTYWPNGQYIYHLQIEDAINHVKETGRIILMK